MSPPARADIANETHGAGDRGQRRGGFAVFHEHPLTAPDTRLPPFIADTGRHASLTSGGRRVHISASSRRGCNAKRFRALSGPAIIGGPHAQLNPDRRHRPGTLRGHGVCRRAEQSAQRPEPAAQRPACRRAKSRAVATVADATTWPGGRQRQADHAAARAFRDAGQGRRAGARRDAADHAIDDFGRERRAGQAADRRLAASADRRAEEQDRGEPRPRRRSRRSATMQVTWRKACRPA